MPVESLDHVQLAMPPGGEDRARRFYGEALGMREVTKPAHLAQRGGCWFEKGPLKIHLGIEQDFRPARKAHPAILVSDLPVLVAHLAACGHPASKDQPLPGYARCYVDDPFGNRIELLEPAAR